MKGFIYFVVTSLSVSCGFLGEDKPFVKPKLPDKDLKEIVIRGAYYPEYKGFGFISSRYCYNETKEENKKPIYKDNLRVHLYAKEGNLITEDFLRLSHPENYDEDGKYSEKYLKSRNLNYPFPFPKKFNLTAEDGVLSKRIVITYLPYDKRGSKYRVISLDGRKKVFIGEGKVFSQSYLVEKTYYSSSHPDANAGWSFDKKSECHLLPIH